MNNAEYVPARLVQGVCPECGQPREQPAVLAVGRLRMDRAALKVWVDGLPTPAMTSLEFEVLWEIASKQGRIMPHWYLEEDCAGRQHAPGTIKTIIHYIRGKLPVDLIETRRGEGYQIRT